MEPEAQVPIHGVDDQELVNALGALPSVPPGSIGDFERFVAEARAILEDRAQRGWIGETAADVAVFLHAPYPNKTGDKLSGTPVANLLGSSHPVLGKLFILNRDASWGRVVDLPTAADSIIDWLIERGLDGHPVIFAYRGTMRLLARAKGAKHDITIKGIIRESPATATLPEVADALSLFHRENLLSPKVCPSGVWEKSRASKYVPGVRPEQAIQVFLRTALYSWFRGVVRADIEDSTPVGRIDVRLVTETKGVWSYWAILELKVLKCYHNAALNKEAKPYSDASNAEDIAEGVRQVDAFARNWNAVPLLEVFDLRKNKQVDILNHYTVTTELAKHSPRPSYRTWPLFGSAKDARIAGY
jgi:hypothetical protein